MVGIIGTGATAIQSIPHLAEWAKELYVFQRTPSSVDRRDNGPTDPKWCTHEIQSKKGWQRERNENFSAHLSNISSRPPTNLVGDEWSKMPSYSALVGWPAVASSESIPAHITSLHALNLPRQEKIRARISEIVKDPTVAERLKPWYPGWCKRPCFHDDYLPTFNRPNVTLVDTDGKGEDRISPQGVIVGESEYELDVLIFSTGFRPIGNCCPAHRSGMSITGRDGPSLEEKWAQGVSTLHGVMKGGFPNLFWPGSLQAGATANHLFTVDQLATHVAYILAESARRAGKEGSHQRSNLSIESTAKAEDDWSNQVMYRAASLAGMAGCTPGWLDNEGAFDRINSMQAQIAAARGAIWGHGINDLVRVLEA